MKFTSDVDIDVAHRDQLLNIISHVCARQNNRDYRKHNTGIYVGPIPNNPFNNIATIDYQQAEDRGYFKLDILNIHLYRHIKSEQHLIELMKDPDWTLLNDSACVQRLIHLNRHWDTLQRCPEPVNSITRLAMFLALIRPGKKHLIGKTWKEISEVIWDRNVDGYTFRRSHAIAYAQLVAVNMNLISRNEITDVLQELSIDA